MKLPRLLCLLALLVFATGARCDWLIGTPDRPPTPVDAAGALHEDWGVVGVALSEPSGARSVEQRYEAGPVPEVITRIATSSVVLRTTCYRAPIWPEGVDVLTVKLGNYSSVPMPARLQLALPDQASAGDRVAVLGGRVVVALPTEPKPIRNERDWGCTGGVVSMPGWAQPAGECDPAFRNIRAGMGGVPIVYRFRVPPGDRRTVALGLCESFWSQPGARPLVIRVEGAPRMEIDPLATWGRHVPGCLRFDARDANGDGRLEITVEPHPASPDRNPILNVIWIFPADAALDLDKVRRGELSAAAEYYVDVGGQKDQELYEGGALTYEIQLQPGQTQELTFLLACPGGSVPDPAVSAWTPESLRRAAQGVWFDWFDTGARISLPAPWDERWRIALALIMMLQVQADGFYAPVPYPDSLDKFSRADSAQIAAALDFAGHGDEAERLLRVFWDKPAPAPLASLAQADSGEWRDAAGNRDAHACTMRMLAWHALVTGDRDWAQRVWPALKAGAAWIARAGAAATRRTSALTSAAQVAEMLGLPEAAELRAQARAFSNEVDPASLAEPTETHNPALWAAHTVRNLRWALAAESDGDLVVAPYVEWFDLSARVGATALPTELGAVPPQVEQTPNPAVGRWSAVGATALPTEFGPLTLKVEQTPNSTIVHVDLAARREPRFLVIYPPKRDDRRPSRVELDGRAATLRDNELRITPASGAHVVTFFY